MAVLAPDVTEAMVVTSVQQIPNLTLLYTEEKDTAKVMELDIVDTEALRVDTGDPKLADMVVPKLADMVVQGLAVMVVLKLADMVVPKLADMVVRKLVDIVVPKLVVTPVPEITDTKDLQVDTEAMDAVISVQPNLPLIPNLT